MKILDVRPFDEGLQRNIQMLSRLEGEMQKIQTAVNGLVALQDSLKGQGGDAIRSFYNDAHLPYLHFFLTFKEEFDRKLKQMGDALVLLRYSWCLYLIWLTLLLQINRYVHKHSGEGEQVC